VGFLLPGAPVGRAEPRRPGALVRKVRFPRELIPGSVVSVQLVTFALMLAILVPVALVVRGTLDWPLLLLPVIGTALFALTLGLALMASVLHAYYRDVEPVLAAALLPWFFVTPIFFRIQDLPGTQSHPWIADLMRWGNPVSPFIEATRDVLFVGRAPGLDVLAYVVGAGALAAIAGRMVFRRLDPELAVVL
jgi:ABC-type polysaccharide/polyol phosphate export permease